MGMVMEGMILIRILKTVMISLFDEWRSFWVVASILGTLMIIKPKVKEADTIKLPAIPGPETYRNWRIKTRDFIVAASTNPDAAFAWIAEVRKEGQNIEALRKVAALDAKLLSALTNITTGDFARKVDTFQETEANEGRIVRGRQVLFMLHDHFSTNMKHGSTYALRDLLSVHLKGENLKTFISNWDQVLAGIQKVPEESVVETLYSTIRSRIARQFPTI